MSIYGDQPEPDDEVQMHCYTQCDRPWCEDPAPRPVPTGVDAWLCACCSIAGYTAYLPPPYCASTKKHQEFAASFPDHPLITQPIGQCTGTCAEAP